MQLEMKDYLGLEITKEIASAIGCGVWKELHIISKLCASCVKSDYLVLNHEREVLRTPRLLDAIRAYNEVGASKRIRQVPKTSSVPDQTNSETGK